MALFVKSGTVRGNRSQEFQVVAFTLKQDENNFLTLSVLAGYQSCSVHWFLESAVVDS
jgi:hypothetical protein